MKDIKDRTDIQLLVDSFYKQVLKDELIGKFFTEVVVLDWQVHIPVMYDFWETVLLGAQKFRGNPMEKHFRLNEMEPLLPVHFDRWLLLWERSVNQNFEGANAREAITRAQQIGGLMKFKVREMNK